MNSNKYYRVSCQHKTRIEINKSKVDAVGIGVDQNAWNANKQSYKNR
jgi:hypothetical protein